ncbi:uncharacterized protein EI90DRAFT_3143177 [Cantharellus anzutake]|uniref:uncharacterized protein n=1 Tax=Cantharellus anzutake TaxID=1750568 RepID=UPI001905ACC6|nr:uncharacterized protein EI90DRAFT_3143177 [Cantharellus anzutake]KAF8343777.1 hypothetical protein EI90DRAFT_3143177 [Cantharellus anzutake]
MSLSPNPDVSYLKPSGKTPPPAAPSAAYARRAREIMAEEGLGRYRPPPLRTTLPDGISYDMSNSPVTADEVTIVHNSYPSGTRRARAGTLPSNIGLTAQHYGSTNTSASALSSTIDLAEDSSASSSPVASAPIARPSLRHATSAVAAAHAPSERNSRLRSGSLTLPSGGLGNAFGSTLFSSSWVPGTAGQRATVSGNTFPVLDELRSITSGDSQAGDDYDVHTLDYLGLEDSPDGSITNANLTEMRQSALLNTPSRMRANTVANPYQRARSVRTVEPDHTEDERYEEWLSTVLPSHKPRVRQRLDSYDHPTTPGSGYSSNQEAPYIARGFKQSEHLAAGTRSRASSMGQIDDTTSRVGSSLSRRVAIEDPSYNAYAQYEVALNASQTLGHGTAALQSSTNSLLRGLHVETAPQQTTSRASLTTTPSVRFPSGDISSSLAASRHGSTSQLAVSHQAPARVNSPKEPTTPNPGNTQVQTPSRSLWIGNLDPGVTGEDLARAFAPYGAIESFRLLPEKECGFVNFVDIADAIRAKDDVLNRLGGSIGMANGQTVRIGFGKADSAPVTPSGPNSGGTHASQFLTTPAPSSGLGGAGGLGGAPGSGNGTGGTGGMDAQLQSTPTRALWIGSIPSTTTPATILTVFSPYGPIESARVLTHKNCGFVNFERLDDAVRARKALNGRDVLGSEVGAIRIGFARVPVKGGSPGGDGSSGEGESSKTNHDSTPSPNEKGVGDLSVGQTIHALRGVKGATAIPTDQQVLGGAVENYRSNLLLSMIDMVLNPPGQGGLPSITEQQLIMRLLSDGTPDADNDVQALAEFRPPTNYYTTIPIAAERSHIRRWDASKLRELRKRLDSGSCTVEEIDDVAADFLDGEIVDLASDWLGNTVVQKLFERCSPGPRYAMLERIAPHLASIGIHKNGTWAAQKVIECASTPEEIALIAINLRPYTPPCFWTNLGIICCLRFGTPANDFIFDAMTDRLWEIAQGRFGARSMRACLESPYITISQQRRIATAVILNSIPLATNPNGALLLTWLLDTSGFHSRYRLLAPRFTPHLSHLCTHKLASLTVLRIVNQKAEPEASQQVVDALFFSPNDHVLTDVLGDQINGVAVILKILQSPYLDSAKKPEYLEATKRVLIDLKVLTAQAYRRLMEEVGLPVPSFNTAPFSIPSSGNVGPQPGPHSVFNSQTVNPVNPGGYSTESAPYDASMASIVASMHTLQLQQLQAQAANAANSMAGAGLVVANTSYAVQHLVDGFREVYGVNPTSEQIAEMVQRQPLPENVILPVHGGFPGRPGSVGPGIGSSNSNRGMPVRG